MERQIINYDKENMAEKSKLSVCVFVRVCEFVCMESNSMKGVCE